MLIGGAVLLLFFSRADTWSKEFLKMDAREPRPRRRGFFLHSSEGGEPDTGEHENPEGFIVRVRFPGQPFPRKMLGGRGLSGGRSHRTDTEVATDIAAGMPAIRSGSVTGSRQRSHLPR
jgi:hypothetical protein